MKILGAAARLLATLALILAAAWVGGAIWFHGPAWRPLNLALIAVSGLLAAFALTGIWRNRQRRFTYVWIGGFAALLVWWSTIQPQANRDWSPEVAQIVTATYDGDIATVSHVRNFAWDGLGVPTDPAARVWETRTYDLSQVTGLDVVSLYWMGPAIGHTYFSFTFSDGRALIFSLEARKLNGEAYSPVTGFFKVNELIVLAGDERDFIGWRVYAPDEDIQMFRTNATPTEARALLKGLLDLGNDVAAHPRFYNTLSANCTTELWALADRLGADLPFDWRTVLSGYVPDYLYDLGRLDTSMPLAELRDKGRLQARSKAALQAGLTGAAYSQALRDGVPRPAVAP